MNRAAIVLVLAAACSDDGARASLDATAGEDAADALARGCAGGTATTALVPDAQAPACDPATLVATRDVAYASDPSVDNGPSGPFHLDLYRPPGAGPFRTVVWIHGGGWMSGDEDNNAQALRLACNGWAVASVDYRLTTEGVTFPAPLFDVKAAIRFLRANAARYALDPDRIVVFGSSAGGHLAALAGVSAGMLEDLSQGNPTVSSRVAAVVDWYGPVDLPAMDAQLAAQDGCAPGSHGDPDSPESALVGCTVGDPACAAAAAAASPLTYLDAADPPFLIVHGDADCNVARAQSAELAAALRAQHVCVAEHSLVGAGHGGPEWTTNAPQNAVREFLDRVVPP